MLKYIFYSMALLIIASPINIAFSQENPLIYQTFIRDDFDPTNGGYISLIDGLSFNEIERIDLPTSSVENIVLTPDKKLGFINASPSVDPKKGLIVVDLENKKEKTRRFEGIGVYGAKIDTKGNVWVLLNETQEVAIINPNTLQTIDRFNSGEPARDIVFSKDGKRAYISLLSSQVIVFDITKSNSITTVKNLPKGSLSQLRPQELELSPDGSRLYIGSDDTISIVDTNINNNPLTPIKVVDSFVLPRTAFGDFLLKSSLDGKLLYIADYLGANLHIYNTENKSMSKIITPRESGILTSLNISADGRLLYVSGFYGIGILDTHTNSFVKTITTSTGIGFPNPFSLGATLTGDFSIGQAPKLQALSPSVNDNFVAGQEVKIRWNTTVAQQSYSIASHTLELSTDGGINFAVIKGAEELSGITQDFTWIVPNIEVTDKAQIRVNTVDLGARRAASTTGNFSILKMATGDTQAPSVIFLSPKGAEKFNSGDNLQISWMSSDNVGVTSQDLSLSTDGGNTFPITIASGLPGTTQSFSFPIPTSLQTNQARLRLIVKDGAGNNAQTVTATNFIIEQVSDTVAPVVTISQPSVNERLIAGQPIQVKWQSVDNRAVTTQSLLISFDGGNSFNQVANLGASDSSFVINNISQLNLTSSQVIVKITATDMSGNKGEANRTFIITPAITNATYQSKVLNLMGIGFMSNSSSSTTKLFINGKEIALPPTSVSNTSFTLKGNKKKLGITRGNNIVKLVIDNTESNSLMFSF